jgi:hypothetical protein
MFYPVFLSRTLCVIAVNATTFRLYHVTLSCTTSSPAFTAFPMQSEFSGFYIARTTAKICHNSKSCTTVCTLRMCVCYPYKTTVITTQTAGLNVIAKRQKILLESNLAHSLCSQPLHRLNNESISIFALDCGWGSVRAAKLEWRQWQDYFKTPINEPKHVAMAVFFLITKICVWRGVYWYVCIQNATEWTSVSESLTVVREVTSYSLLIGYQVRLCN